MISLTLRKNLAKVCGSLPNLLPHIVTFSYYVVLNKKNSTFDFLSIVKMGVQEYHANQFLKENKKKYGISNVTYTNRIMYLNALHVKNMNCICASRLKQNVIYVIICN